MVRDIFLYLCEVININHLTYYVYYETDKKKNRRTNSRNRSDRRSEKIENRIVLGRSGKKRHTAGYYSQHAGCVKIKQIL